VHGRLCDVWGVNCIQNGTSEKHLRGVQAAYGQSKLANILYAKGLAAQ